MTKDIFSPVGEKILAGPRAVATVGGQVYVGLATAGRIYLLCSQPQSLVDGSTTVLYTYATSITVGARLDMVPTPAGCHLVWDNGGHIWDLFLPWGGDAENATLTEVGAGILPVCFLSSNDVVLYYVKKQDGLYRVLARRTWSVQSGWSGEETIGTTGDQYAGLCAGLGEEGPVAAASNYRWGANQLHIFGVDPGLPAVIDSVYGTITALAFASASEGPYLLWHEGDTLRNGQGITRFWHAGTGGLLAEACIGYDRLSAAADDGTLRVAYQDTGEGGIRYYEAQEGPPFESLTIATTGAAKVIGLNLLCSPGGPLVYWVPASRAVLRLTYPVTTASVAAFTCSGRELPGAGRYFYYPGAEQNNRLRLKVTPERPLPNGLYADLGAIPGGARIDGVTGDGGCTYVIEGSLPDAPAGIYPIGIREATTNTELARFEAFINVRPDLAGYGGETTDWTAIEDFTRADVVLHREGVARIAFTGVDLTGAGVNEIVCLGDYLEPAGTGILVVDAGALPTFRDLTAQVTFYGLPYTSAPDVLVDGQPAGGLITGVTYTPPGESGAGVLSFNTAHLGTLAAVPRVEVQTPADGATVDEPQCTVAGTVNEPGAVVEVSIGGAVYTAAAGEDGAWALDVPLQEGENLLRVVAVAGAGQGLVSLPRTLRVTYPGDRSGDDGGLPEDDPPGDGQDKPEPGRSRTSRDGTSGTENTDGRTAPDAAFGREGAPVFYDIAGHWARGAIEELAARGWVRGAGGGCFAPDRPVTRAEMAALCLRLLGIPGAVPAHATFTDVLPGSWYYAPVEAAYRAGLVAGLGDTRFAPERPVTRQEMVVLLLRTVEKAGAGTAITTGEPEALLGGFVDGDAVASWARDAVAEAVELGLIRGRSGRTLAPGAPATRAEAAVLVLRLLNLRLIQ
ncbi:MAG: S-layer homology domain-containing protein [Desulfotomaculales bacterium]